MAIFPLMWLVGAVIAAICFLTGFDQVLLIQGIVTCLYLLTLIRWRRRSRIRRISDMALRPPEEPDLTDPDRQVEFHETCRKFGGGDPDDLQPRLLRKAMQMEQRKLRLQVTTL
ncbi:hypothetical protein M3484_11155 [Pseudomonas sp. GX19020]|uniref:hypothetical protein n=1 Tax=Pseudomonas sp. GX19020 TaxID=2942277 RepID=UPI0020198E87|nr:hypothetical protein [Pseudomonas sp. GX19020]MCL4067128.1 hypothetical protein [Pseudomonas sp. GX19020]